MIDDDFFCDPMVLSGYHIYESFCEGCEKRKRDGQRERDGRTETRIEKKKKKEIESL